MFPAGAAVAFLGPDGVGKSTIIRQVARELGDLFDTSRHYHLRPFFGRAQVGTAVADPHGQPPRRWWLSVAKLLLWWLDYWVSFLCFIYPAMRRPTLILFDRYFDDLLVDPKRYRFGGPFWLARVACRLLPRPDLVILLDAPPEVLLSRKQEVPAAEVRRQRAAYQALCAALPNGHIVDAARPVEQVVADVHLILRRWAGERSRGVSRCGGRSSFRQRLR